MIKRLLRQQFVKAKITHFQFEGDLNQPKYLGISEGR